jgi:hypothetical protein
MLKKITYLLLIFILDASISIAQYNPPVVTNVDFNMRTDGSRIVDITYNVNDADGNSMTITVKASSDDGVTWNLSINNVTGDIGSGIISGNGKTIVWNAGAEHPNFSSQTVKIKIIAEDGITLPDLDMVTVEGGTFMMGSNSGNSDEQPIHYVTLSTFKIAKFEITQRLWEAVMGNNPSYFTGDESKPVEQVSWNEVQLFITKLNQLTGKNYRLPTEAEWEYAARGGNQSQGYTYAGSNDVNTVAWYYDNGGNTTHPVGTKAPNELGIYDMSGNVWEWCNDWYSDTYYSNSPNINPPGPSSGTARVLRSGFWGSYYNDCRTTSRSNSTPTNIYNFIGARLVIGL